MNEIMFESMNKRKKTERIREGNLLCLGKHVRNEWNNECIYGWMDGWADEQINK